MAGSSDGSTSRNWDSLEEDVALILKADGGSPTLIKSVRNQVGIAGKSRRDDLYKIDGILDKFYLELRIKSRLNAAFTISDLMVDAHLFGGTRMSPTLLVQDPHEPVQLGPYDSATVHLLSLKLSSILKLRQIRLALTSQIKATFRITSVSYLLNGVLKCTETLARRRRGKRLHATKEQLIHPTYAQDTSLDVAVREPVPTLNADLSDLPTTLFEGESVLCHIRLSNSGSVPLSDLIVISDHPSMVTPLLQHPSTSLYDSPQHSHTHTIPISSHIKQQAHIRIPLAPKITQYTVSILVHGRGKGLQEAGLLFAYSAKQDRNRYYTTRRLISLTVEPSVHLKLAASPSFDPAVPYRLSLDVRSALAGEIETDHL
jgi:hypothetical protein